MTPSTKHVGLVNTSITPLVTGPQLLEVIWPGEESRPAFRTLLRWKKLGLIPFIKIGKLVYYDPEKVRQAIDRNFTVTEINY